jgi:transcriptional regulator of nitric oxide reductase
MSTTLDRLLHLKVQEVNPDLYEQCIRIASPPLRDLTLLPSIMQYMVRRHELSADNLIFMISIAYYLTAPHKLYSQSIKLAPGIREVISNGLGFNSEENVNHYSKFIIPMWKNKRFRHRVESQAAEILEAITNSKVD